MAHRGCLGATDFSAVQENRPFRFSLHGDSASHGGMGCAVIREIPCCPEPEDGKLSWRNLPRVKGVGVRGRRVGNIVFVGEDDCRPHFDRQVGRIKGKVADSNPSRWGNLPSDFARGMGLGVEVNVGVPAQEGVYGVIKGVDALGWLRLKVRSGQGLSGSVVVQREDDGSCLPHCLDMDVGSRDILQPRRPDEDGDLVLGVVESHDGGASGIGLDRVRGFLVARQLGCQRDGTNLPSDFASGMGLSVKVDIGVPAQKRIHDIIKSQASTDRNLTFD